MSNAFDKCVLITDIESYEMWYYWAKTVFIHVGCLVDVKSSLTWRTFV